LDGCNADDNSEYLPYLAFTCHYFADTLYGHNAFMLFHLLFPLVNSIVTFVTLFIYCMGTPKIWVSLSGRGKAINIYHLSNSRNKSYLIDHH